LYIIGEKSKFGFIKEDGGGCWGGGVWLGGGGFGRGFHFIFAQIRKCAHGLSHPLPFQPPCPSVALSRGEGSKGEP